MKPENCHYYKEDINEFAGCPVGRVGIEAVSQACVTCQWKCFISDADAEKAAKLNAEFLDEECLSCGSEDEMGPDALCPHSKRPCGHHCNHSWTHDYCCWCGQEWGEEA